MNPNDSILIADIIRYAYSCHNYEAAAPIIHLLDKYCGTTDHAQEIWLVAKTFLGGWYKIPNHPKKYAALTAVMESEN
jgi:hypothetical protein